MLSITVLFFPHSGGLTPCAALLLSEIPKSSWKCLRPASEQNIDTALCRSLKHSSCLHILFPSNQIYYNFSKWFWSVLLASLKVFLQTLAAFYTDFSDLVLDFRSMSCSVCIKVKWRKTFAADKQQIPETCEKPSRDLRWITHQFTHRVFT